MVYRAPILIGTPPQTIDAALDIDFADLVVPSRKCEDSICEGFMKKYVHGESATFLDPEEQKQVRWPGMVINGYSANDVVRFGELTVEGVNFVEGTDYSCWTFCQSDGYEGILGLMAPWKQKVGTILGTIDRMKLLERGLISMRLPRARDGDKAEGELVFGAHRAPEGDVTWVPLHPNAAEHGWAVSANAIVVHTREKMRLTLPIETAAVFKNQDAIIILPDEAADKVAKSVGAKEVKELYRAVNCTARSRMPDLTLVLGDEALTITPWEYVMELQTGDDGPFVPGLCSLAVHPLSWYSRYIPPKTIVLGSAFLRGFEWIGDWENSRIGCKPFHEATVCTGANADIEV